MRRPDPDYSGQAFPGGIAADSDGGFCTTSEFQQDGMTMRQWFAGQALAGLCANPKFAETSEGCIADMAVSQADELLQRLKKGPEGAP